MIGLSNQLVYSWLQGRAEALPVRRLRGGRRQRWRRWRRRRRGRAGVLFPLREDHAIDAPSRNAKVGVSRKKLYFSRAHQFLSAFSFRALPHYISNRSPRWSSWYPRKPSKFLVMGSNPGEWSLFLTFVPEKLDANSPGFVSNYIMPCALTSRLTRRVEVLNPLAIKTS